MEALLYRGSKKNTYVVQVVTEDALVAKLSSASLSSTTFGITYFDVAYRRPPTSPCTSSGIRPRHGHCHSELKSQQRRNILVCKEKWRPPLKDRTLFPPPTYHAVRKMLITNPEPLRRSASTVVINFYHVQCVLRKVIVRGVERVGV